MLAPKDVKIKVSSDVLLLGWNKVSLLGWAELG